MTTDFTILKGANDVSRVICHTAAGSSVLQDYWLDVDHNGVVQIPTSTVEDFMIDAGYRSCTSELM